MILVASSGCIDSSSEAGSHPQSEPVPQIQQGQAQPAIPAHSENIVNSRINESNVTVNDHLGQGLEGIDIDSSNKVTDNPGNKKPKKSPVAQSSRKGNYIYVANAGSDSVSVIDSGDDKIMDTIELGASPTDITASIDGKRVFVISSQDDTLLAIDAGSNEVVATINLGCAPDKVAASPDGKKAYVVCTEAKRVLVVDIANERVSAKISQPFVPIYAATTLDGRKLYVSHRGDNAISVIDTNSNSVRKEIRLNMPPGRLVVSPDGKTLYFGLRQSVQEFSTEKIDIDNDRLVTHSYRGTYCSDGFAVSPDGKNMYCIDSFTLGEAIAVSDLSKSEGMTVNTRKLDFVPRSIAMSAKGDKIYLANRENGYVCMIDIGSGTNVFAGSDSDVAVELENAPTTIIAAGYGPIGMAVAGGE
jgi:YVTN family beta-propeller protein